jgi:phosphatidylserine/phosphatidylglycerophosphate/cardiolipin synthase-like enzyme
VKDPLLSLAPDELRQIADSVLTDRLKPPFTSGKVDRLVCGTQGEVIALRLNALCELGMAPPAIAASLEIVAQALEQRPAVADAIDLVTTGPEVGGVANRNTAVVVDELFRNATDSVLVAGYAIYQGQKIFRALAERMKEHQNLSVKMFLDVPRPKSNTDTLENVLARFAHEFRKTHWPSDMPLPSIFCCTRLFGDEKTKPGSLHAKCVAVDNQRVFISSANFTEAAQERNIEVGVLINSSAVATRLAAFFETALDRNIFTRVV